MKLINFIRNKQQLFEKMFIPFVIMYFILVSLPYFAYSVPILGDFVSKGTTQLIYRGMIALLFILYAVCVSISYRIKPNYPWIILLSILLITSMLVPLFSPTFLVTSYTDPQFLYTTISSIQIGMEDNISSVVSLFFDLSFAYCFLFIFPYCLQNRKHIIYILLPVIFLMLFECTYSIIFERSQYMKLFSYTDDGYSGYDIIIQATFGSKNDFGDFLLQAIIAGAVCFVITRQKYHKIIYGICVFIFFIFSILSLCKTAIVGEILLFFVGFIFWLIFSFKKHRIRNLIIVSALVIVCAVGVFAVMAIFKLNPSIEEIFVEASKKTLEERKELWNIAFYMMRGPSLFFGYSKTLANYNLYYMSGETNRWFHNGFIYIYCSYGIIGLSIYLLLLSYIFLVMVRNIKFNKNVAIVSIAIFVSFLVLTMAEQVILGISGSASIFIYNFAVVLMPIALAKSHEKKGKLYESFN